MRQHSLEVHREAVTLGIKVSVGVTSYADLFETEGLSTQGSRPGRSARYLFVVMFALNADGSDQSIPYLRYQTRH